MSSFYQAFRLLLLLYLLLFILILELLTTLQDLLVDTIDQINRSILVSVSQGSIYKRRVTIDILPDEILLYIFHFNRVWHQSQRRTWRWHRLVHVCRRWRSVGFASPKFLQLRLVCGPKTPVELTGVWPPVPIIIQDKHDLPMPEDFNFDAAIVHPNRVREINFCNLRRAQFQRLDSAMQRRFPALRHLKLYFDERDSYSYPALSRGFLGGSARRLQSLMLNGIAFHALPRLLLTTTNLVRLSLYNIPHSGYIPPKNIISGLAALPNLKFLIIGHEFSLSRADRKGLRPPPPTFTVLPSLTLFEFRGVSEYVEDFVARIDAPLLDSVMLTITDQYRPTFDTPQLAQFMRRSTRVEPLSESHVNLRYLVAEVKSLPPELTSDKKPRLTISCGGSDWRLRPLFSLSRILRSFFPFIHMVEHLNIRFDAPHRSVSQWQDFGNTQCIEVFRLFIAVKNLYVCKEFAESDIFVGALQELAGERVTNTLPALESLYFEEMKPSAPVEDAIGRFVAARHLLGHPVTVSYWDMA